MSNYKTLYGKKVKQVEKSYKQPLENILPVLVEKDMTYRDMVIFLENGVAVTNIQQWLKKMSLKKTKKRTHSKKLTRQEVIKKYQLTI